uniref:Microtubule-associated protein Jupiter n=1 Tax=Meloidogyne hapla TaxID=6305 RepID=A0A1I8BP28_MELHA
MTMLNDDFFTNGFVQKDSASSARASIVNNDVGSLGIDPDRTKLNNWGYTSPIFGEKQGDYKKNNENLRNLVENNRALPNQGYDGSATQQHPHSKIYGAKERIQEKPSDTECRCIIM